MKDKIGMLVALIIVAAGVVFVKMSGPLPQPVSVSHTVIIEPSALSDEVKEIESEEIGETTFASKSADLEDIVIMPDESSLTYQKEFVNAEKAMQNP